MAELKNMVKPYQIRVCRTGVEGFRGAEATVSTQHLSRNVLLDCTP